VGGGGGGGGGGGRTHRLRCESHLPLAEREPFSHVLLQGVSSDPRLLPGVQRCLDFQDECLLCQHTPTPVWQGELPVEPPTRKLRALPEADHTARQERETFLCGALHPLSRLACSGRDLPRWRTPHFQSDSEMAAAPARPHQKHCRCDSRTTQGRALARRTIARPQAPPSFRPQSGPLRQLLLGPCKPAQAVLLYPEWRDPAPYPCRPGPPQGIGQRACGRPYTRL